MVPALENNKERALGAMEKVAQAAVNRVTAKAKT